MARVTVEDCVDKVANHFELVMLAAHRARERASVHGQCLYSMCNCSQHTGGHSAPPSAAPRRHNTANATVRVPRTVARSKTAAPRRASQR